MLRRDTELAGDTNLTLAAGEEELQDELAQRPGLVRRRPELIFSPLLLVLIFAVWHYAVELFDISVFIIPAPMDVIDELWKMVSSGDVFSDLGYTLGNMFAGFAIGGALGVLVGGTLAMSASLERVLHPYLIAIQTFPKIAIVPVLTIWFGFDETPKIIVAAILAFFPIMVNTYAGMLAAERDEIDLMRSLKATPVQVFLKLRLPRALPSILAGVELASVYAMLGAVTAEFLGSSAGLGQLIQIKSSHLQTDAVFAVLVIFAIVGVALYELVRWVRKLLVYWQ
jgi:NitT/TauT family transport system permease protein